MLKQERDKVKLLNTTTTKAGKILLCKILLYAVALTFPLMLVSSHQEEQPQTKSNRGVHLLLAIYHIFLSFSFSLSHTHRHTHCHTEHVKVVPFCPLLQISDLLHISNISFLYVAKTTKKELVTAHVFLK